MCSAIIFFQCLVFQLNVFSQFDTLVPANSPHNFCCTFRTHLWSVTVCYQATNQSAVRTDSDWVICHWKTIIAAQIIAITQLKQRDPSQKSIYLLPCFFYLTTARLNSLVSTTEKKTTTTIWQRLVPYSHWRIQLKQLSTLLGQQESLYT